MCDIKHNYDSPFKRTTLDAIDPEDRDFVMDDLFVCAMNKKEFQVITGTKGLHNEYDYDNVDPITLEEYEVLRKNTRCELTTGKSRCHGKIEEGTKTIELSNGLLDTINYMRESVNDLAAIISPPIIQLDELIDHFKLIANESIDPGVSEMEIDILEKVDSLIAVKPGQRCAFGYYTLKTDFGIYLVISPNDESDPLKNILHTSNIFGGYTMLLNGGCRASAELEGLNGYDVLNIDPFSRDPATAGSIFNGFRTGDYINYISGSREGENAISIIYNGDDSLSGCRVSEDTVCEFPEMTNLMGFRDDIGLSESEIATTIGEALLVLSLFLILYLIMVSRKYREMCKDTSDLFLKKMNHRLSLSLDPKTMDKFAKLEENNDNLFWHHLIEVLLNDNEVVIPKSIIEAFYEIENPEPPIYKETEPDHCEPEL